MKILHTAEISISKILNSDFVFQIFQKQTIYSTLITQICPIFTTYICIIIWFYDTIWFDDKGYITHPIVSSVKAVGPHTHT